MWCDVQVEKKKKKANLEFVDTFILKVFYKTLYKITCKGRQLIYTWQLLKYADIYHLGWSVILFI